MIRVTANRIDWQRMQNTLEEIDFATAVRCAREARDSPLFNVAVDIYDESIGNAIHAKLAASGVNTLKQKL